MIIQSPANLDLEFETLPLAASPIRACSFPPKSGSEKNIHLAKKGHKTTKATPAEKRLADQAFLDGDGCQGLVKPARGIRLFIPAGRAMVFWEFDFLFYSNAVRTF